MKVVRPFLLAVQFLTRLPVPLRAAPSDTETADSLLFHPLVGLLIGLLLLPLAAATAAGHVPVLLGAALSLALWVGLTGGLHLDGLADSVDAWIGGHGDRERSLAIMKDPASGPMAVITLVLLLLIKFAALAALLVGKPLWPLLLAPVLGRTALPLLFLTTPYVRPGGLGSIMAARLRRGPAWLVVVIAAGAALVPGCDGLWPLAAGLLAFIVLRRMMLAAIGGTTGDTAGAVVELVEASALVAAAFHLS